MRLNLLELAKIALALLSIFALSGQVMAGVYKCLDRQNRTYYQDSPCQEMMAAKLLLSVRYQSSCLLSSTYHFLWVALVF